MHRGPIAVVLVSAVTLAASVSASAPAPASPSVGDRRPGHAAGRAVSRHPRLSWSDEFNGRRGGAPDRRRWVHRIGDWGKTNGELETNTSSPSNASVDGRGHLALVARRADASATGAAQYTSARLETQGRLSVKYGRIEARMKLPPGSGLWPAFWMLGDDIDRVGWPACGEIDIMESIGQDPGAAFGTIHGPLTRSSEAYALGNTVASRHSLVDGFHTYGVIWRHGAITWTLDGARYARVGPLDLAPGAQWRFEHAFHLVLSLAVGGDWPGAPDASTAFPARLLVDWVRVYR